MLNIISLALGIAAWIFPAVALVRRKDSGTLAVASLTLCTAALLCQLMESARLAGLGDFSALADTADARARCGIVLAAVTIALNAAVGKIKKTAE